MIYLFHLLQGKIQLMLLGVLLFFPVLALAAPPADLDLKLVTSVSGKPVAVRHAGDGSGRIFIVEKSGKIYIHDGSQLLPTPFLDIPVYSSPGEAGLLGLAFHPNFAENRYFYVNYTVWEGSNMQTLVSRFQVPVATPNVADPATEQILLQVEQPYANHNGGDIHFGNDGYLYIGMGDGGDGYDPDDRARDLGDLLGKMLRIDVDGNSPGNGACGLVGNYGIPGSNPYKGNDGACDEIWASGLRNPWRWSFDRSTGDLIIGDVGQGQWEEVDFQSSGSTGGEYYGWSCMEGNHVLIAARCDGTPMVAPILEYAHLDGNCSITGGYRYRGPILGMGGLYFYADYCTGNIWYAQQNDVSWSAVLWRASGLNVSSFGEDEAGNLYVADLNGGIYRFESAVVGNTYTIGGTISGLASGNSVVLLNNGGDNLSVNADGSFTFASPLLDGGTYEVTVLTQPTSPNQTCMVTNDTGTVSGANVTNVDVSCVTNTYTVGGTITGLLSGDMVVLQNNDTDDLSVSADGGFAFATALDDGSAYDVTVLTQPSSPNQICAINNGDGTLSGANVTNIEVICATNYCSQFNETVNYTVQDGEQFICTTSGSIQAEDFTVMDGGDALLRAPEVFFVTDQQRQVSVQNGGTLTVTP